MVFAKTNHLKINKRQDSYLFALSNEIKFWNHYLNLDRLRIIGCLSISEICNYENTCKLNMWMLCDIKSPSTAAQASSWNLSLFVSKNPKLFRGSFFIIGMLAILMHSISSITSRDKDQLIFILPQVIFMYPESLNSSLPASWTRSIEYWNEIFFASDRIHLVEYFSVTHFSLFVVNSIGSVLLDDPLKLRLSSE